MTGAGAGMAGRGDPWAVCCHPTAICHASFIRCRVNYAEMRSIKVLAATGGARARASPAPAPPSAAIFALLLSRCLGCPSLGLLPEPMDNLSGKT